MTISTALRFYLKKGNIRMSGQTSIFSKFIKPAMDAYAKAADPSQPYIALHHHDELLVIVTPTKTGGKSVPHCLSFSRIAKAMDQCQDDPAMTAILQNCKSQIESTRPKPA
jgi:hypothetical protein